MNEISEFATKVIQLASVESWWLEMPEQPTIEPYGVDQGTSNGPCPDNVTRSQKATIKSALRRTSKEYDLKKKSCSIGSVRFATQLEVDGVGRQGRSVPKTQVRSAPCQQRLAEHVAHALTRQSFCRTTSAVTRQK